jgi:hypothetical protein
LYNSSNHCNFSCADYTIIEYQEAPMDPKNKALMTKLEQSRARLNAALERVSPQDEIYPEWRLKQLLDHITGWDELTARSLRLYLNGESTTKAVKGSIDQFNEASISARKALTLEDSRIAYEQARQSVLQILAEIPANMLAEKFKAPWGGTCSVNYVVKIFSSHELEHARHLEESLQAPDNPA